MSRDDWRHCGLFALGVFGGMAFVAITISPVAGALFVIAYYAAYVKHSRLSRDKRWAANGKGKRT